MNEALDGPGPTTGQPEESRPRVHHLSLATCPVTVRVDGRPCGQGSGLLYLKRQGNEQLLFMVTSRQLLAPPSDSGMSPVRPNTAVFQLRTSADNTRAGRPIRIPLYSRDGNPIWLESRKWRESEIVAIPVPGSLCEGISVHCVDRGWSSATLTPLGAGAPLHVVGFPYSLESRPGMLPLWHSGSLASDPGVGLAEQPALWANVPPFPGMAGAPVVAAPTGGASSESEIRRLVGIYAGARSLNGRWAEEAGIHEGIDYVLRTFPPWGSIWRADLIDELIENADIEAWQEKILARLP